jgi:hypothetical protein
LDFANALGVYQVNFAREETGNRLLLFAHSVFMCRNQRTQFFRSSNQKYSLVYEVRILFNTLAAIIAPC